MDTIAALLFDKDGTLFDFRATWGAWTGRFVRTLGGPSGRVQELAEAIRFDLEQDAHLPGSPFIAGSIEDWVDTVLDVLPELEREALMDRIREETAEVPQVPVTPLADLLGGLRGLGYRLGVATNDGEGPARAHLDRNGIASQFDFIAGYDSGHGAKPAPHMLLAFAKHCGLRPAQVLMIGDSTHDLHAAAAAGMPALAVLTGYASNDDLAPHAEAVLPSIADLPDWLQRRNATAMSQTV
ncbi:HAD family hydrolase [Oceanibium sediminis]|uniref:HAD family hydrolase n=1 Tax=Oceanibium sediminis TaxID=2026339 RepID=UPI000DD44D1E|nr:HAD family hydrolase [Oceanibium sediminis]